MSSNLGKQAASLIELPAGRGSTAEFPHPSADTLTYEPFFGLTDKPFSLNFDSRFLFDSPSHAAVRKGLLAGIRRREGLLVLTGEIGTGKTTLCRSVLRHLGRATCGSLVPDPFASREDLLKTMLVDFGVLSIPDLSTDRLRQATRTELGFMLAAFLEAQPCDAFSVVVIDEAQNLSLPLIEETRILFDTFGAKGRLQIVFAGQPELHAKLQLPEMRQVDQRVCGYHRLKAMSRDAVLGYVQHRLQAAGAPRERVLFPQGVVDTLHRRTGGVPRLVNRVCDRALQVAFERKADSVNQEILETALIDVGSVTLSPTWDAIVFAEQPPPPVTPLAQPVAAPPAVTEAPAAMAAPRGDVESFKQEIADWGEEDLAASELAPIEDLIADLPPAPSSRTTHRRTPHRQTLNEWPRDVRSETYIQKALRIWANRAAIAIGALVILNVGIAGVSLLLETQTPAPPQKAPAQVTSELPPAPAAEPPVAVVPATEPVAAAVAAASVGTPASPEASGDYLVAVGLFADRDRADALVDRLTKAGLPAMQRPSRLGRRDVQQIVLGPFLSRGEAAADLQRLRALGGYDDARVLAQ